MSPETHRTEALVAAACRLLDRALLDYQRSEREQGGSTAGPLYLAQIRWDLVRHARDVLEPLLPKVRSAAAAAAADQDNAA